MWKNFQLHFMHNVMCILMHNFITFEKIESILTYRVKVLKPLLKMVEIGISIRRQNYKLYQSIYLLSY